MWRLIRKLFGKPKGRHAIGVPNPAPEVAISQPVPFFEPAIDPATFVEPAPEPTSVPVAEPPRVVAPAPDPVAAPVPVVVPAPVAAAVPATVLLAEPTPISPLSAQVADLGPVRLIFSDGTIAPLPAGSPEDRRARYLAQRVLEATARH